MMSQSKGAMARAGLACASVAVAAIVVAVVVIGVSVSEGRTLEIEQGDEPVTISLQGSSVVVTGSVVITSYLNESIDDVRLDVWLVDDDDDGAEAEEPVSLFSLGSLSLPSNGSVTVPLEATVPMSSLYFVLEDFLLSALEDSDPSVTVRVTLGGDYLLGLLSAEVDGLFTVSLAEVDGQIEYDASYTGTELDAWVSGLAPWVVPADGGDTFTVSSESAAVVVDVAMDGDAHGVSVNISSRDGLVPAIQALCASSSITVTNSAGDVLVTVPEHVILILNTLEDIIDTYWGDAA